MSEFNAIPLGTFDLYERIGRGGMGAVYRGRHRDSDTAVAVKVLLGSPSHQVVRRFLREIRAHAALLHPSIVELIECGTVGDATATAIGGQLQAGTPFVAMELADGGVVQATQVSSWPAARRVLEQVLRGLAYAHARGVIHRDLKPANLLVFKRGDEARVKLADFGIAHALVGLEERPTHSLQTVVGTPRYMAPEQLLGRWRDHGPWTDIYGVGCIAHLLVAGSPPFQSKGGVREVMHQLANGLPELVPRFQIPQGVAAWIRAAADPVPTQRYQTAAEALAALPAANAPLLPGAKRRAVPKATKDRTRRYPSSLAADAPTMPLEPVSLSAASSLPKAAAMGRPVPMDVPTRWAEGLAVPSATSMGAGLGLFGLRDPPLIGRAAERRQLWSAFRDTVDGAGLRVCLLRGPAGCGKSKLARELTMRAHEQVGAQIIELGDVDRDRAGLESVLRTWRLDREQVFEHVNQTLPSLPDEGRFRAIDVLGLTELLRPEAHNSSVPSYYFPSERERLALFVRLFERLRTRRPTVVWFDDLHGAETSLSVMEQALANDTGPSVLIVATVRPDLIADQPSISERLAALANDDRVQTLDVGPLEPQEARRLADSLAPLPEDVAATVVNRMEGNPLFGLQLLADWVERGCPTEAETRASLPADIHAAWVGRFERLARRQQDPALFRRTVMLAAAFGKVVARDVWEQVPDLDEGVQADVWDGLVAHGLARSTNDGWRFAHGLLVDSLRTEATKLGWATALHLQAATALERRFEDQPFEVALALAEQWIAAGEFEKSLGPLNVEANRLQRLDDHRGAVGIQTRVMEVLDQLAAPDDDLRRIESEIELAVDERNFNANGSELRHEMLRHLKLIGDRDGGLRARAYTVLAVTYEVEGNLEEALDYIEQAVTCGRREEHDDDLFNALLRLGRLRLLTSDFRGALEATREAEQLARDQPYYQLRAWDLSGWALLYAEEFEDARSFFDRCVRGAREAGYPAIEASSLGGLARCLAHGGDFDRATDHFSQTVAFYEHLEQADNVAVIQTIWGHTDLEAGNPRAAMERYSAAAETLERLGYPVFDTEIRLGQLLAAVALQDWSTYDDHVAQFLADDKPTQLQPNASKLLRRLASQLESIEGLSRREHTQQLFDHLSVDN